MVLVVGSRQRRVLSFNWFKALGKLVSVNTNFFPFPFWCRSCWGFFLSLSKIGYTKTSVRMGTLLFMRLDNPYEFSVLSFKCVSNLVPWL